MTEKRSKAGREKEDLMMDILWKCIWLSVFGSFLCGTIIGFALGYLI